MGQYWVLFNLDKRHFISYRKLGESFYSNLLSQRMLERPGLLTVKLLPYFKPPPFTPSPGQRTGLDGLPDELVDVIFECLDNHVECIQLALTARRYWNLARPHIKRAITKYLGSSTWAGDRLICVGDNHQSDDVPPALQNDAEFAGVDFIGLLKPRHGFTKFSRIAQDWSCRDTGCLRSLLSDSLDYVYDPHRRNNSIFTDSVSVEKAAPDELLVLRNLSKHEYVRYSMLPTENVWDRDYLEVDLAFAAQTQICWSTYSGFSMAYEGDLHRGQWAGDRLDITSIERLEELDLDEGGKGQEVIWKDVSERVAKEVKDILDSEFS